MITNATATTTTSTQFPEEAERLRRRAATLRELAARVERAAVMRLHELAGPDTWRTPRGELCRNLLVANQSQARHAIDELRRVARRFEEHAAQIEADALVAAQTGAAVG